MLPELGNRFVSSEKAIQWNYENYGDTLYILLVEAFYEEKLICLALDTRKVYVGLLGRIPNLEPDDEFVRILPFYSGYRDSESLILDLPTSYKEVYRRIADEGGQLHGMVADDFEVVIPVKAIKTASFFSEQIYDEVFAVESEDRTNSSRPRLLAVFSRWWDHRTW